MAISVLIIVTMVVIIFAMLLTFLMVVVAIIVVIVIMVLIMMVVAMSIPLVVVMVFTGNHYRSWTEVPLVVIGVESTVAVTNVMCKVGVHDLYRVQDSTVVVYIHRHESASVFKDNFEVNETPVRYLANVDYIEAVERTIYFVYHRLRHIPAQLIAVAAVIEGK